VETNVNEAKRTVKIEKVEITSIGPLLPETELKSIKIDAENFGCIGPSLPSETESKRTVKLEKIEKVGNIGPLPSPEGESDTEPIRYDCEYSCKES